MSRSSLVPATAIMVAAVAVWQTPATLRSSLAVARKGATSTRTQRELLPAHVVGVQDTSVFPRLASLMPRNATYSIELSHDAPPSESAGGEIQAFLDYYLLPRRAVPFSTPSTFTIFIGSADIPRHRRVVDVGAGVHLMRNR